MRVSPSKIADFRDCPRKYWWRYVAKIPVSSHPSAEKGKKIHKLLEQWGLTGILDCNNDVWPIANVIGQKIEEVWEVKPPFFHEQIEQELLIKLQGYPNCVGRIDLFLPPVKIYKGVWGEAEREIHNIPLEWWAHVIDYKTTSSWKWIKSESDLLVDPQAIIYSLDKIRQWPFIRFSHVYGRTSGTAESKVVSVSYTPSILRPLVKKLYREDIWAIYQISQLDRAENVSYNLEACGKYGGCPFQSRCASIGVNPFVFLI